MRLSELVKIKSDLLDLKNNISSVLVDKQVIAAHNYINALSAIDFTVRPKLLEFFKGLKDEHQKFVTALNEQIVLLEHKIEEKSIPMLTTGYTVNGRTACSVNSPDLERSLRIYHADPDIKNQISGIISLKTRPQFASLEIGPGDGQWTEYMVSADPLYIVDIHQEFLTSTVRKFEQAYQTRIRPYLINDLVFNDHILEKLPQSQFGFVFAWDVFTFFPADYFEKYLESIYQVLKPGGCVLFNYNNCENFFCAQYAETGFQSWMPKYLLEKIVKKLNFTVESFNSNKNIYWTILRKPGSLQTVKGLQALGKIISF